MLLCFELVVNDHTSLRYATLVGLAMKGILNDVLPV